MKDMEEEYSTNKPPLLRRENYDYWKEHMIAYFESIHIDLWDVMENGNHIPINEILNEVPKSSWTNAHKQRLLLNSKSCNALLCALKKGVYQSS